MAMTSTALTAITAQSRPGGITGFPVAGVVGVTGVVTDGLTVVKVVISGVVADVVVSVLLAPFEVVTSANGRPSN